MPSQRQCLFLSLGALLAAGCKDGGAPSAYEHTSSTSAALGAPMKVASFPDGGVALPASVGVAGWASLGSKTLFSATNELHGTELWVTDGTMQGTGLVSDTLVGPQSGIAGGPPFVSVAGLTFFSNTSGWWRTDGTPSGTFPVTQFQVKAQATLGSVAYAISGTNGPVYRSDGTVAGTTQLLNTVTNDIASAGGMLFIATGCLANTACTCPSNPQGCLFKSDGTPAGTTLIPGTGSTTALVAASSRVFYVPVNASKDIWTSDGTSTTKVVTMLNQPVGMTALGSSLIYWGDGSGGRDLWQATATGASDIKPLGQNPVLVDFGVSGSEVYFSAHDSAHGTELWKSDGTATGTSMVVDLNPGSGDGYAGFFPPIPYMNGVVFTGNPGTSSQLYYTDGTAAGTVSFGMTTQNAIHSPPHANGSTLFFGDDQTLWEATSPGPATVSMVAPISLPTPPSPSNFVTMGSKLYFLANAGNDGPQLWSSDGTAAGTVRVSPSGMLDASTPYDKGMVVLGNKLYFSAASSIGAPHLYVSDGTAAGTHIAANQSSGPLFASGGHVFFTWLNELWAYDATNGAVDMGTLAAGVTPFNGGVLFYSTNNGTEGFSDGTPAGTVHFAAQGAAAGAAVLGNAGYFLSYFGLYRTDGSSAGTTLVKAFSGGGSGPVATSARLYFGGTDTTGTMRGIWQSDGTASGTTLVFSEANPNSNGFGTLYPVGDRVMFIYDDGMGPAWFLTDGTTTTKLTTAKPGLCRPFAVGTDIFFCAADEAGEELWTSDGTAIGTSRWADLNPGPQRSAPANLTLLGSDLYFTAYEGATPSLYVAASGVNPTGSTTSGTGNGATVGASNSGSAATGGTVAATGGTPTATGAGGGGTGASSGNGTGGGGSSKKGAGCGCRVEQGQVDELFAAAFVAGLVVITARSRKRARLGKHH